MMTDELMMTDDSTATPPAVSMSDDAREQLVAELVTRARAEGGDLVGPMGCWPRS